MKTKKYLIGLFCLIMVIASVFGIVGCEKNDNSAVSEINGVYYCDTENGEYTIELKDGKITLTQGEKSVSGSYGYDKTTFTVKFTGKEASAQYNDGVINLTYDGATYSYLPKVEYTVKFVNGKNTLSEQNVVNGRSATQPADPSATEGKKFLTWYSDADLTKIYNFANRITGDTTIYAKFVDYTPGEEVYTVSFVCEGEEYESVETIGQIAYNLPTPAKDGSVFAGWYVSQYGDATKLSYKYNGQKIYEDTVLYANFVANATEPVIESVSETGISWKSVGVNKNYSVTITNIDDDTAVTASSSTLKYSYDFANATCGNYKIELTVDGKTATAYYKNKALAKISHIDIKMDGENETDIIEWNAIENAEKYVLSISCGDPAHNHTAVEVEAGTTQYNFEKCAMKEGGIEFVVKACADGYVESTSNTYVVNRTLESVGQYAYNGDYVSWTASKGATSYDVTITSGEKETTTSVTEAKVYVGNFTGNITISVVPVSRKYNSADETTYSFSKSTLASPATVSISLNTISWTQVEGASSYNLKIGDKVIPVTGTSYDVTDADIVDGVTKYEVSVSAVSSDSSKNSGYSLPISATYGEFLTAPVYNNKVVTWDVVLGSSYYGIKVGSLAEVKVNNATQYTVSDFTSAGTYKVVVTAYKANGTALSTTSVDVKVYKLTYSVNGGRDTSIPASHYADTDVMTVDATTERYGYNLLGWYDASTGDAQKYETGASYEFGKDATLYARWDGKYYTVHLDLDGLGEFEDGTYDAETGVQVKFGDEYTLPVPDTTNVVATTTFKGWYTDAYMAGTQYANEEGESNKVWGETIDMTLFAGWAEVLSFTPIYNTVTGVQNGAYSVSQGKQMDTTTEVEIPSVYNGKPVITIEANAFYNNRYLKKITIPNTIQSVELGYVNDDGEEVGSAFGSMTKLAEIEMVEVDVADIEAKYGVNLQAYVDACKYSVADGALLYNNDYNGIELKYVPVAKVGEYVVPTGVETLPINIMKKKTAITKLTIPYTVKTIAENAFMGMSKLKSVIFEDAPEGTTPSTLTIDTTAFKSCTMITKIVLPARLSADTDVYALLSPCTAMIDVEFVGSQGNFISQEFTDSVDATKKTHFVLTAKDGVSTGKIVYAPIKMAVANVVIPSTVTEIGDRAFYSNKAITTLEVNASVKKIGVSAFYSCTAITSITLKEDEADNVPLEICNEAFRSCNNAELTSISIPARTVSIGEKAFYSSKLATITFNGTKDDSLSIGAGAFQSNSIITSVVLTPNIKSVAANAFNCTKLVTVTFNAETDVDYEPDVFSAVTTVNIGASAPAVEINGIFGSKVAKVTIAEGNENYTVLSNGSILDKTEKQLLYVSTKASGTYEIPSTVEYLGANVFKGKTSLTKVVVGVNVSYIGSYTFSGCTKLATVEFAEGGTADLEIAPYGFNSCTSLTAITLPSRTKTIGAYAFASCSMLKSIAIPEGVTSIGDYAFRSCTVLASVSIPSTVTAIGDCSVDEAGNVTVNAFSVFTNCNALEDIIVAEGNANFAASNGVLYTKKNGSADYLFYAAPKSSGEVVIPSTVTAIAAGVFKSNTGITSVSYSDALSGSLTIGDNAFYGCTALETVSMPSGVKEIGMYAFYNCTKLGSVTIPSTVVKIGAGAFTATAVSSVTFETGGTEALEIQDSVSSLGKASDIFGVFQNCTKLTSVVFPDRVLSLGSNIFKGCSELVSITINEDITYIGKNAFSGCAKLEALNGFDNITTIEDLPDYFLANTSISSISLPASLKTIGGYAFAGTNLTEITIPASVERIGYKGGWSSLTGDLYYAYLFNNCKQLKTVVFEEGSKLTQLTDYFFNGCSSLDQVVLPDGVELIGSNAFAGSGIKSITIPASVTEIEVSAFAAATELTTVTFEEGSQLEIIGNLAFRNTALTSFTFPETDIPIELGDKLFLGCMSLTELHLSSKVTDLGDSLVGCSSILTVDIPSVNKNMSLVSSASGGGGIIYNYNKTSLKVFVGRWTDDTFTVADGVTEIEDNAFSGQYHIKRIVIPASVKSIGEKAFYNCINLESVEFADYAQLESIGKYAFQGCEKLTSVTFPSNLASIGTYAFAYSYLTSVNIPASVKTIDEYAFYHCDNLTSVTGMSGVTTLGNYAFAYTAIKTINIPDTVKALPSYLFSNCSELVEVTGMKNVQGTLTCTFSTCPNLKSLPSLTNITALAGRTFSGCSSLETVDLPSVKTMKASEFSNCTSLKSVTGTSKLTSIAGTVFQGCTALESVDLSALTEITGNNVFKGCALKEVDLSSLKTVTATRTYIFADNAQLTKVTLGSNLTLLPNYMFQNCTALTSIVIPDKVTQIGTYVFDGCTSLKEVKLGAKVATIGMYAFRDCTALESIDLSKITKSIASYAFKGCTALKSVDLSSLDVKSNVSTGGSTRMFEGCTSLENVVLGEKMKILYNYTFLGCTSLKEIDLSNILTIGSYAFSGCSSLSEVTFSKDISDIKNNAFEDCVSLTSLDFSSYESLASIGASAFAGCSKLSSVKLSDAVATIGATAFESTALTTFEVTNGIDIEKVGLGVFANAPLTSFTVAANATKTFSVIDGVLYDATGTTLYLYPSAKVPNAGTETAGTLTLDKAYTVGAFYGANGITKLVIANADEAIAAKAFSGFTSLKEVVIPATVTSIGDSAFENCINLTTVTFDGESALTKIGKYAFQNDTSLTTITLPSKVTTIDNYAFQATGLTQIVIPDSVTTLGTYVLAKNVNLVSVTLPDSLKELPNYAFFGCTSLATITLPSKLTKVGDYTFKNAGLTSITLPKNLTTLSSGTGGSLFAGCESLTSVTILGKVTKIPTSTFEGCTSLETVLFAGQTASEDKTVVIPSTVTEIGNKAFYGSGIYGVVIPSSVTKITDYPSANSPSSDMKAYSAFGGCERLKTVQFNANKLTSGSYLFTDCTALETVVFADNIESFGILTSDSTEYYINRYMFYNCTALKNVTLSSKLVYIPNYMFYGCTSLESLTLPSTVTGIGTYAFGGSGIKNITLNEGITNIGEHAFENCASLESIVIPSTVEYFTATSSSYNVFNTSMYYTFRGCSSLKDVEFKCDVSFIGQYMFTDCVKLENIKFKNTPEGVTGLYIPKTTIVNRCAFMGLPSTKTLVLEADFYDISASYYYSTVGSWYTGSSLKVIADGEVICPGIPEEEAQA